MALLAALTLSLGVAEVPEPQKQSAKQEQNKPAAASYWLTIRSGIRHNQKCRYFKNSKGREATKSEGRACKICRG